MDGTMGPYQLPFNSSISFSIKETAPFIFPTIAGAPSVVIPQILLRFKPKMSMKLLIACDMFTPAVVSFSDTILANSSVILNVVLIPLTKIATCAVSVESVLSSSAIA